MAIKLKIFIVSLVGLLFLPALALAAEVNGSMRANASSSASVGVGINFCTNLPKLKTQIETRLTAAQSKLKASQDKRLANLQERQSKRAEQLKALRAAQDAARAAIYVKLTAKATTTAQSQAVVKFKADMEAAVIVRRSAVDAAIATYWTALNNDLKNRQAAVMTAEQNFISAMNTALSTASSECGSATAGATVRAHFGTSIEAAKSKFAQDRKAIDKFGPQVKISILARNQAIQKAVTDFKAAVEKARVELKVVFGK